jgi:hypothetical protein
VPGGAIGEDGVLARRWRSADKMPRTVRAEMASPPDILLRAERGFRSLAET